MKTLKLFISQPMTGRTTEEIRHEREGALQYIQTTCPYDNIEEINSFNENALNDSKPIAELGKCISLMADADIVVFCRCWCDSKGCNVEHEVARQYGIPRAYI